MVSPKIEHMTLFIGWSRKTSKKIAETLCDYIAKVNPYIVPFVSSVNIAPGKIWRERLSGILRESHYGILCMTKENLQAPWLHYEAGILSMATSLNNPDGEPRIAPLLFGVESASLSNPLSYYQSAPLTKDKFLDLMQEANEICIKLYGDELSTLGSKARMERAFLFPDELEERVKKYFQELEGKINEILASSRTENGGDDNGMDGGDNEPDGGNGGGNGNPPTRESDADTPPTQRENERGPHDALTAFSGELNRIYGQFSIYPDIARVYFEGRQLVELLLDENVGSEEKQDDLQRFRTILKETITELGSQSTQQRQDRSQAIKKLLTALENLPT